MLADELLHHLAHLLRSNVAIHMQRVGLAREFIHYAQHPVIASFHRPIMDEVPAPDMSPVGSLLRVATGGAPGPALLLAGRRHRPALLAAHLSHSCVTYAMSLPANQPANLASPSSGCSQLRSTMLDPQPACAGWDTSHGNDTSND